MQRKHRHIATQTTNIISTVMVHLFGPDVQILLLQLWFPENIPNDNSDPLNFLFAPP